MCQCTPEIRTPFCGRPGCKWPEPSEQEAATPRWYLISDETYRLVRDALMAQGDELCSKALHELDTSLHTTDAVPSDFLIEE